MELPAQSIADNDGEMLRIIFTFWALWMCIFRMILYCHSYRYELCCCWLVTGLQVLQKIWRSSVLVSSK